MIEWTFTDIGLFADLVGATLLSVFGLAPILSKGGVLTLSVGKSDHLERKASLYDKLAKLGILLIIVGFAFQLFGNHDNRGRQFSELLLPFLLLGTIVGFIYFIYRLAIREKYKLSAYYIPQYDARRADYSHEHLWEFRISNNTKVDAEEVELRIKGKPSTVFMMIPGEPVQVLKPSSSIKIDSVEVGKKVRVRVWGMGGHETDGHDSYVLIAGIIIRPEVHYIDPID